MRKSEIDCDPAKLFFWQAIRIGACQRFNQGALPMIDVSRRGEDEVSPVRHHRFLSPRNRVPRSSSVNREGVKIAYLHAARMAAINSSSCRGNTVRKSIFTIPREI